MFLRRWLGNPSVMLRRWFVVPSVVLRYWFGICPLLVRSKTGHILYMWRTYIGQECLQIAACTTSGCFVPASRLLRALLMSMATSRLQYGYSLGERSQQDFSNFSIGKIVFSSWKVDFGYSMWYQKQQKHHVLLFFYCFIFLFGEYFIILHAKISRDYN